MSDAQPITGLCPGDLAPHAFVCGDPARVERITAAWDEQRVVAQVREYTVVTGSKDGVPLSVASHGIGESLAVGSTDSSLRRALRHPG